MVDFSGVTIAVRITLNDEPMPSKWRVWTLMRIARLLGVPLRTDVKVDEGHAH